jgi:uncharacterized protein YcfJ
MNNVLRIALAAAGLVAATQAVANITFYENEGFSGRSFAATSQVRNFERAGFNDRASSVIVFGERWEVCEDSRFSGRCVVLRPGRYPSLASMGLNDRVSSVRMVNANARVEENRYAPAPVPVYDNRRRRNERLFEAEVTSVREVVGPSEQRCWVERGQGDRDRGANVPGAVLGALIGGVLGHQVGSGRGNDAATIGGAVAGGAIGSQAGRGQSGYGQDVRRCETVPTNAEPAYWDVTYTFRGEEHRIQMAVPPGRTVTVNARGEPRA